MARSKPVPVKSSKNQSKKEGSSLRKNPKSKRNLIREDKKTRAGMKPASKAYGTIPKLRSGTAEIKEKREKTASSSLPPELRHAGLLASQNIAKGKCFGPFRGIISKKRKIQDEPDYHFVCQVNSKLGETLYFHVHEVDKANCSWLKLVKSCSTGQEQNIVVHTTGTLGVCYEAIKDISAGEELVAFYDDTYGKNYPAYVEALPISESDIMNSDSSDVQGDGTNVEVIEIVNINRGDGDSDNNSDDESDIEEEEEDDDDDDEDYDVDDDDYDVDDDDGDYDDEDIDDDGDNDGDNDDDNDDDDDPEYVPSNYKDIKAKSVEHCLGEEPMVNTVSSSTGNVSVISQQVPITVLEVVETITSEENGEKEKVKFQCSHCSMDFESRDVAEKHAQAKECIKNQSCQLCGIVFTSGELLENHDCKRKPRCRICNMAFTTKLEKQFHHRKCHAKPVECPVCHKTYNKSYMRDHLMSHQGDAFKCDICEKQFSSRSNLFKHKRKHNPDYVPPPDPRRSSKSKTGEYWCVKCNIQFERRAEMMCHRRKEHPDSDSPVECPICHKKYNSHYMRDHLMSHNSSFKCDICEKLFSSRSNLCKHKRKHSPDYVPKPSERRCAGSKRHECQECQKKFDTPTALEVHKRSHTGERPFACEKCEWKFSQKTHLTRHMNTVHSPDGPSGKRRGRPPGEHEEQKNVPCEKCGNVYASHRVLQVHMQTVHLGQRPHKCNHCEATFTQRGHLWRHKHAVHPEAEEVRRKIESGKYTCHFEGCGLAFPCHSDLVQHVARHTGEKQFLCDQCGATFASKGNLNKHKKRRHRAAEDGTATSFEAFPCSLCGKVFSTSSQLQLHTRSHTGEKPYKCDLCKQGFVQKSGLNKHIRCKRCPMIEGPPENPYPSKVKKHECKDCKRMFPGLSELRAHERTHTGEKPFQCTICLKAFSQPGNLSKHIRYIHKKEKRPKEKPRERKFFCSLCGKAFMCASSLNMHCRTHTGSKPFACQQCDQSFAQAGNLKKHITRCHESSEGQNQPCKRKATVEKKSTEKKHRKSDKAVETSGSEEENSSTEFEIDSENEQDKETGNDATLPVGQVTHITPERHSPSQPKHFMSTFPQTPLNTASPSYFVSPLNTLLTSSPSFGLPVDKTHFTAERHDDHLATAGIQGEGSRASNTEQCLSRATSESCSMKQSRNVSYSSTSSLHGRPPLAASGNLLSEEQQQPHVSLQQSFFASVEGILAETAGSSISSQTSVNTSRARPTTLPHMHTMLNSRASLSGNIIPSAVRQDTNADRNMFQFSQNLFNQS